MKRILFVAVIVIVIGGLVVAWWKSRDRRVMSAEVRAVFQDSLPASPHDKVWKSAPVHLANLIVQDMVEPRLMEGSTPFVEVQAVTDGERVSFRLAWPDSTKNDLPIVGGFADACAVQVPANAQADTPAPQMGQKNRRVEISYWSAFWQASVDGRPDTIRALYPQAQVDHYPFESQALKPDSKEQKAMEKRYAPARALGNLRAGPRKQPVEDLIAEGPGTLTRAARAISTGRGQRTEGGWAVVLIRPLPNGVKPGSQSQVAFAVWDGDKKEAGARKMRSPWISFNVEASDE